MNVVVEESKKVTKLGTGDVVFVNGSPYIVMSTNDGFIAKGFDGCSGSTGHHETIEALHESLKYHKLQIYPQSEYELVLRKKS